MARARSSRHEPADGVVRARRAARRRGDHHARALPVAVVRVYTADGCTLCQRALEIVNGVRAELGFELEVVDIAGDPELEARYRELIPVVEVDGERAFTYFVDADGLHRRLNAGR